jgi:aminomethyltransferase
MSNRTGLYDLHLKAHAKIVDFAGWDMPLHYGSQLEEHLFVRTSAGIFDVSHMAIVDIKGSGVKAFLQFVLANDIAKLKEPGQALYTCMLNERGGILDDLIVYYFAPEYYRLVVNAGTTAKDLEWLKHQAHANDFKVNIEQRADLSMLAVQGPKARASVLEMLSSDIATRAADLKPFHFCHEKELLIARTGYTGEDGFELMLPHDDAREFWQNITKYGVKPIGLGARDTLRLEAGLNLYGTDMDESVTPYESNLAWTVALTDENRKFMGREALVAQKALEFHDRLTGIVAQGRVVLRHGQTVQFAGGLTGVITSGTFSPTLQCGLGFVRVPAQVGETGVVMIRNKEYPVDLVKPPFVRFGKKVF